jgi:glycerol-3-phosphate acyltransferase PlsY
LLAYILVGVLAYLLGSIPTGFLLGKARGLDMRRVGSGNIGATNVFRALGKWAGAFVLLADAFKGWVAVALVSNGIAHWLAPGADAPHRQWLALCAGICAILGHNYTCWLSFKGGKGIATSAGVMLGLAPWALLAALGAWILVFGLSRYVSLASICAAVVLPIAVRLTGGSATMFVVTGALAALAIFKHKANIRRLINGTENRLGGQQSTPAAEKKTE